MRGDLGRENQRKELEITKTKKKEKTPEVELRGYITIIRIMCTGNRVMGRES